MNKWNHPFMYTYWKLLIQYWRCHVWLHIRGVVILDRQQYHCSYLWYFCPPLLAVTWAVSALPWLFWTNNRGTRRAMAAVLLLGSTSFTASIQLLGQLNPVMFTGLLRLHLTVHCASGPGHLLPETHRWGQQRELDQDQTLWATERSRKWVKLSRGGSEKGEFDCPWCFEDTTHHRSVLG